MIPHPDYRDFQQRRRERLHLLGAEPRAGRTLRSAFEKAFPYPVKFSSQRHGKSAKKKKKPAASPGESRTGWHHAATIDPHQTVDSL